MRWPHCPGSPREEARYPDIAGEAAIDGTGSHLQLELCMTNNVHALQYDQQIIGTGHEDNPSGWLVDLDRCARVQQCLDYVSRRVQELQVQFPEGTVRVESETRSDPGAYFHRDDWWGTVDITILVVHSHTCELLYIEIADYKDGRMWVPADDNSQLLSYLWGKVHPYFAAGTLTGDRMTIIQPKTNPVVRYCDGVEDLHGAAVKLATAAAATDDPFAVLIPGKHCQWCAANPKRGGHCTAAADQSLQTVVNMSTEIIPAGGVPAYEYLGQAIADVSQLTEMQLAELSSARAALNAVFDDVDADIVTRIEAGKHVSGKAMRPGHGSNGWTFDEKPT
ncbi:MAG: DUF2800 domain-containing protein, partial [bacterium]|nr:DUF2800 domain-containing protein [bacterium]